MAMLGERKLLSYFLLRFSSFSMFLFTKTSMETSSQAMLLLKEYTMLPESENRCSEAVLLAGMERYFFASAARWGVILS